MIWKRRKEEGRRDTIIPGRRYRCRGEDEEEKTYVVIGRQGKASSKKWNESYNVIDENTGARRWVDFKRYEDIRELPQQSEEESEEDQEREGMEQERVGEEGEGDRNVWWVGKASPEKKEISEAKRKELQSWIDNNVYETETDSEGKRKLSVKWVITQTCKEGQGNWKARLVVRGFEEDGHEMVTDAPTCSGETLKLCLSVMIYKRWECRTLDVKTAYLQGEKLKREVWVIPPKEAKKEGMVWKLKKGVYGLKDAARVWYDSLVKILTGLGGKRNRLEPTVFTWSQNGSLTGIMCTHVDDICYGGNEWFHHDVIGQLKTQLKMGKESRTPFKYIGIDVTSEERGVLLSQNNYLQKLEVPERSLYKKKEKLSPEEQTRYRSLVGKLNWLCQHTRPDLAYGVSYMSQFSQSGNAENMRKVLKLIEEGKKEVWRILLRRLGAGEISIIVYADESM